MLKMNPASFNLYSRLGPNGVLGLVACDLAADNQKIVFLTADLGVFSGLSRFLAMYPDRFYNVGIAEQNMIGIAAGLAAEGKIPFAVTYATFAVLRAADQIKTMMAESNLPVKLIGVAAGLSIGINGSTHVAFEDMAVIRALPNIAIISPADCTEAIKAIAAASEYAGPVYIRLTGTFNNPPVYKGDYNFEIGKAVTLLEGNDITFIATGSMVNEALGAAAILRDAGLSAGVINMHTIRPLDCKSLEHACCANLLCTVEEHSIYGGLGGAVAEFLASRKGHPPLVRIGLEGYPAADDYKQLLTHCGLTAKTIAGRMLEIIKTL